MGKLKYDIQKVDREIALRAGLNLPTKIDILAIVKKLDVKIGKDPVFILWNDGKPVANEIGGEDVIACLFREGDTIKGWSQ